MKYAFVIGLMASFFSMNSYANTFDLFIETGGIWQHRNDTEIVPGSGTRVEIDNFNTGPFFHYRLEAYLRIKKKHAFRMVYAPANFEVKGRANKTIVFNGVSFPNTEDLRINYKFNSYRVSYIYALNGFSKDQMNIGFTAKIRDAETTFSQSGLSSSYDNIGFVPLFYFEYQKALGQYWKLNFNTDLAAAPQGRAIDVALKLRRSLNVNSTLGIGLRSLEGGADNEKVFTFSWFNYALLEFSLGF